jgi:uncharacterized protein YukE
MNVEEFEKLREENPNEVIMRMAKTMEEGGEKADTLRSTLSTTSRQALSGLGQNLESVADAQESANEQMAEGGSLTEEFNAANSTFNAQVQRLKNRIRNVGIEIGQRVLPHLSDFLDVVSDGVDDVQEFLGGSQELRGSFEGLGSAFEGSAEMAKQAANGDWRQAFNTLQRTHERDLSGLETALVESGGSGGVLNEMVQNGSEYLQETAPEMMRPAAESYVATVLSSLGSIKHILIGPDGESGVLSTMVDEAVDWLENTAPGLVGEGAEMIGEGIRWALLDLSKVLVGDEDSVIWSNMLDVVDWFGENGFDLMVGAGKFLVDGIIAGFAGLVTGLVGAEDGEITKAIDEVIEDLEDAPANFKDAILGWGEAMAGDLRTAINDELDLPFEIGPIEVAGRTVVEGEKTIIPRLAQGGVVTEPTMAMVGEGGEDEAVLPLSKLESLLSNVGGGGGHYEIVIPGDAIQDAVESGERRVVSGELRDERRASDRLSGRPRKI